MTDDPKPWSIRSVHPEVRNAALAAAKREGVTIGEWLDRAIRSHVKSGRKHGENTSDNAVRQVTDLSDAERLVSMITQLSEAGAPVPKSVASKAYAIIRDNLKGVQKQQKPILPSPETDL
jgi:RIO-like serine/threonine protein kinase